MEGKSKKANKQKKTKKSITEATEGLIKGLKHNRKSPEQKEGCFRSYKAFDLEQS